MVAHTDLTKPIVIETKVPAPLSEQERANREVLASRPVTIELRSCSELVEFASPVEHFSGDGKIKTIQDYEGNPIIFAVGTDAKLYCLIHRCGFSSAWTLHDISPSSSRIVTFDVLVISSGDGSDQELGVFVAVATLEAGGYTQLYTAFVPALSPIKARERDTDEPNTWSKIAWRAIPDPEGEKVVKSLHLGFLRGRQRDRSSIIVFAGTKSQKQKAATIYAIDPTPEVPDPWKAFSPAVDAQYVKSIQPGSIVGEDGVFVLTNHLDQTKCILYSLDAETFKKTNSKSILQGGLGKINAIYSSLNPWNYTDLVIACEHGIGFVDFKHPTWKPVTVQGLPDIKFKDVVCSEISSAEGSTYPTSITMFALSTNNELYYIEGSRQIKGETVLLASGLPIRRHVSGISCIYNAKLNSSELIYMGTGASEIKRLLRDSKTTCWTENPIQFEAPTKIKKYTAYATTISLRTTTGHSIGSDFPVKVAAETTMVLVNDRSYTLSSVYTEMVTDSQGRLVLVSPATDSLKAPTYVLEISQEGISHRQEIHAAQRIVEALSSIDSIEKLASATSTTGAPIFAQGDLEKHKEGFEESTELLRGFPAMMEAIGEKDVGQPFADSVVESSTVSGFGAKVDAGNPDDEAAQAQELSITQFLGDALEWIRNAAKTIVKASYKILYKGVKLVLNLAGKIISLVIDTVGPLLHTIDQFLKEKLGLDFKKLFKWLGLTFDNEKTKDNQRASLTMRRLWLNILTAWQILKASITKILALPGEVVRANTGSLENLFDTLAKDFKPFVGDRSKPKVQSVPDPLAALRNSKVGWLLDNPVIAMLARFTPISIIMEAQMEAMEEEYGPSFQIPSLTGLLNLVSTTLVDLVGEEVKIVVLLLQDLWEKIKDVIHNPSLVLEKLKSSFQDVFYAIFDAIKALVKSIWQLMGQVMEEISNFLRQEWKIPLTTALFEWYADQNFSFLNLTTFIIARVLGLVVGEDALASYIDIEDDLMCMTEAAQTSNLLAIHPETATAHYPSKVVSASPLDQHAHRAHPTFEHIEVAPPLALQSSKFQHEQKLSKDAKARLHKFEKQSKICTCVVGLLRFSTVIVEAVHAMSVAKFKKGDLKHNDGSPKGHPGLSVSQATLITITTGLTAAGSVAQFFIWQTARDYSEEVRHHLDDHYQSQLVGHWGGLGCDMGALVASIVGLGLQMKKGSGAEACASASVLLLGAGSLCEIFGVHVVPECSVNDPVSTSADWLEASATVSGLVAHFAAHKGAVKVAMGAAVGDGFLSLLSLILGVISVTGKPTDDHEYLHRGHGKEE